VTAGGIYREIGRRYRANLLRLLGLAVVVFIPVGLARAVPVEIHLGSGFSHPDSIVEVIGKLLWFSAEVVVSLLGLVFYSGAVGSLIAEGDRESLGELLRRLPYAPLVAIDLLVSFGTLLAALLLIVPGVLFLAYHSLAAPLAELEGLKTGPAMRRSRALVRGHLATVTVVVVPLYLLTNVLGSVAEQTSDIVGGGLFVDWLGTTVVLIATSPFYALATVLLTLDLRDRRPNRKDVTVGAAG
jgi:hypothetical protein